MAFSRKHANSAIKFFERYLRHTKGRYAGVPFILEDWQKRDIIRPIFGRMGPDGYRQYRQVLVEIPRKNGKSEIGAGVALKLLCADGERGAEVYSAAADRDQAALVYSVAEPMVQMSPVLSARCRITASRKNIVYKRTASRYRVISAEGRRQHGLNPSGIIFDEVHTQRDRRLWDALQMGTDVRSQPLVFAPTTAGIPDDAPLWWDLHEYARQVREGVFEDPTFYSVFYGASPDDDFDDPKVWRKANPALGSFLSFEKFEAAWRRAKRIPSEWNEFLRYRLNVPTQQADRWLSLEEWDACGGQIDWANFRGRECVAGIDLSTRRDITALVLAFKLDDDRIALKSHFWLPQANVPTRLEPWVRAGYIETTPGNAVDYAAVRRRLNELGTEYAIKEITFDEWNAQNLATELTNDGFEVSLQRFGLKSMSWPSKEFETWISEKMILHDRNPVLRWMADCVAVRVGPTATICPTKPDRYKSEKRIDGIVAAILAFGRLVVTDDGTQYIDPHVRAVG